MQGGLACLSEMMRIFHRAGDRLPLPIDPAFEPEQRARFVVEQPELCVQVPATVGRVGL